MALNKFSRLLLIKRTPKEEGIQNQIPAALKNGTALQDFVSVAILSYADTLLLHLPFFFNEEPVINNVMGRTEAGDSQS